MVKGVVFNKEQHNHHNHNSSYLTRNVTSIQIDGPHPTEWKTRIRRVARVEIRDRESEAGQSVSAAETVKSREGSVEIDRT